MPACRVRTRTRPRYGRGRAGSIRKAGRIRVPTDGIRLRNQYDGLELLHLRVDENRVLCTDFDQYHCVINRWPCAPLDADRWTPAEYDRWLDEHWDDPAEKKRLQYRANAIADPKRLPDRWIQACLWTITPHDVVDIRPAVRETGYHWGSWMI